MLATAVVEASCVAELPCSGASKLSRCYTAAESFYYAVRALNARLLPPHDRPTNQLPFHLPINQKPAESVLDVGTSPVIIVKGDWCGSTRSCSRRSHFPLRLPVSPPVVHHL